MRGERKRTTREKRDKRRREGMRGQGGGERGKRGEGRGREAKGGEGPYFQFFRTHVQFCPRRLRLEHQLS